MEDKFIIMMAPLMIAAFVYVIMGIANYKRRIDRYEEFEGVFGPFKAYMFATFCMGPVIVISGIIGLILNVSEMQPLTLVLAGVGATLLAVLIGWLTAKKAPGSGAVGQMFLAGLGTFWRVELFCLKIAFFFILIIELFNRRRDD